MVLMADSTQSAGVKWGTASAASIIRNEIPSGTPSGSLTTFTLANTPVTNSLNLFQNGALLLDGTADYSISANTITFVTAPLTGDKLKADYLINSGYFAVGASSFNKETMGGTPNGTLTTFTTTGTPVANTEFIYRDGQLLTGGSADYYMTNNTATFTAAPLTSSVLIASYQSNNSVAGNADLLDGQHGSYYASTAGTETLTNKTLTSPVINTGFSGSGTASGAEVTTGTADTKIVTPKALGDAGINLVNTRVIASTRDLATASGTVTYTGAGFTPTSVIAFAAMNGTSTGRSIGWSNSGLSSGAAIIVYDAVASFSNVQNLLHIQPTSGNNQVGAFSAFTSDGLTVVWTKTGSPTGTASLTFICSR